jgi:hypothetical protein
MKTTSICPSFTQRRQIIYRLIEMLDANIVAVLSTAAADMLKASLTVNTLGSL